jgi:hypothetical protein
MTQTWKSIVTVVLAFAAVAVTSAQSPAPSPNGGRSTRSGSDPQFKVRLDFNRWHDTDEIKADLLRLEKAWPKFLKYSSLGKSHGGRDLMLMTINNPDTGAEMAKPAMYVEANVHGNEIQGAEVSLYTVWYLMEHYDRIPQIKKLVDERVFYIVPTVKYVPGKGTLRVSSRDKRLMEPVPPGETGDWVVLGSEGLDNDGDGRVNEDPVGGYDGNRNWASNWQPNYIQGGAMDYPFQLPEARAINDFLMAHPNIAGVQSYHNSGGMILRGPGAEWQGEYPRADVTVYDELGRQGERMLPYYRYLVIWSGLYTVHGGFIDWTNDGLGMLSFSNELWNGGQYFNSPALVEQQRNPDSPIAGRTADLYFDDFLEFGDQYVEWAPYDHPQFGKVEMGGWKKTQGRVPPRFMNEELCHRNMAFSLYQTDEMPLMKAGEATAEALGGGVHRVRVEFTNPKLTPTILAKAAQNNVVRPDLVTVSGQGVSVLSAGWVRDRFRPGATQIIDQKELSRIQVRNGHPGRTTRVIEYVVKGSGPMTVTYDSAKGGRATATVTLK